MLTAIARTFILYLAVILILRIMGKRQIGELQPFELAITIMISALAALPMEDIDIPLLYSIVPMLLLLIFQEIISYITLNSNKTRSFICGEPSVLIRNGQLMEKELAELKINMNDLLEQLRIVGYHNLEDIEYAIMETTGNISVIPKSQKRPLTPEDLNIDTDYEGLSQSIIIDGEVQQDNLKSLGLNHRWLQKTLKKYNIESPQTIFYAALDSEGDLYYQKKRSAKN
ncbi:MAG: DUF421 domain-containing protein [Halanaerobiaceae bacterium]